MNTASVAEKVAAEHKVSKGQAKQIVEDVLRAITYAAAAGEEVSLPGFGKFKVKEEEPRATAAISGPASR